jgi:hypothetical protein
VQEFIAQFPDESVTAGHPTAKAHEDFEAVEGNRRAATTFLRLIALRIPIGAVLLYFATAGRRVPQPHPVTDAPLAAASSTLPTPAPAPEAPSSPALAIPTATPAVTSADASPRLAVTLSVSRACWISARADGVNVIQRTLRAGERQTIDVSQELVLTAGDAAAVTLTLNGAEAKPLGKSGEVVTARMSPANFRGYLPNP